MATAGKMSNIARFCLKKLPHFLLVLFIIFSLPPMSTIKLLATDFEVFGRVQGVFFRKYTEKEATKLGLKGWCMNTSQGTVKGVMEGDANKIADMKNWLQKTGSPQSIIDKAVFTNEREIQKFNFDKFSIKR